MLEIIVSFLVAIRVFFRSRSGCADVNGCTVHFHNDIAKIFAERNLLFASSPGWKSENSFHQECLIVESLYGDGHAEGTPGGALDCKLHFGAAASHPFYERLN